MCAGMFGMIGYAPTLLFIIVMLMVLFINSVLAGRFLLVGIVIFKAYLLASNES